MTHVPETPRHNTYEIAGLLEGRPLSSPRIRHSENPSEVKMGLRGRETCSSGTNFLQRADDLDRQWLCQPCMSLPGASPTERERTSCPPPASTPLDIQVFRSNSAARILEKLRLVTWQSFFEKELNFYIWGVMAGLRDECLVLGAEELDFGVPGATALEEGWEEGIIIQRSTCM